MSWEKTRSASVRLGAGASAAVLTAAVILYAPIGLGTQSPTEMAVRTHLLFAMVLASAAGIWILTIRPRANAARLVSAATAGFNCIWIFSFVGLPVVVASIVAISVSVIGVPRRRGIAAVVLAIAAFVLGLVVLRLTEPPGEHIFG